MGRQGDTIRTCPASWIHAVRDSGGRTSVARIPARRQTTPIISHCDTLQSGGEKVFVRANLEALN